MDEDDFSDDIEQIEARIEALAQSIERCRKISLAAKMLIAAGAAWLALLLLGLVTFEPYQLIAALAAIIGGIVLVGSNSTTWQQTQAALDDAEAMRADLIGRIPLRVVEPAPTLH
jgi:hypothetical protein